MKSAKPHPQEVLRIEALHALNILDSVAESQFDAITRTAASLCGAPIALISLVDEHRQWFKSVLGLPATVTETSRDVAFCAHAIHGNDLMEVRNASEDERFHDNPLVTGDPNIKFYAGQPLIVAGMPVGTLCVVDQVPRQLTEGQRGVLKHLGSLVQSMLAERRLRALTDRAHRELEEELDLAREVLRNLTRIDHQSIPQFREALLPAKKFSGDLITSAISPGGQLYGLFADVTGHGLASALFQIPAVDSFKGHVTLDSSVEKIARGINARLKSLSRTGHFMAAIIFCHDAAENRITIWNGGMPEAWLLDEAGVVTQTVKSSHVALGILPDDVFDDKAVVIDCAGFSQLLMMSDGVLEAVNVDGEEFGQARAQEILPTTPRDARIEMFLASIFTYQEGAPQHDDIAVALLNFHQ
jgi:serine phosphatase RsbU (regulator of sigma subunit)